MYKFSGFTQMANNALNAAVETAENLGHTYIGSEHLLVGLRALRQNSVLAEILELKERRAGLNRSRVDLRRVDFREALGVQIIAEAADNSLLDPELASLAQVAQRHRAQVQDRLKRRLQLPVLDRNRHLRYRRRGEDLDLLGVNLKTVRRSVFLHRHAADLHGHALGDVLDGKVRLPLLERALHDAVRLSQNDKCDIRHITDIVDRTAHGDFLANFALADDLIAGQIRPADCSIDKFHTYLLDILFAAALPAQPSRRGWYWMGHAHKPSRRFALRAPAPLTEIRIPALLKQRFMLISVAVPGAKPDRPASSPSGSCSGTGLCANMRSKKVRPGKCSCF